MGLHDLFITMKADINSVMHMTTFLGHQVLVVSRTGKTSTSFFLWWRSL